MYRVSYQVSAVVLDEVVGKLPQVRLPPTVRGLTTGLELADPDFDTPGTVDVLLGSDVLGRLWCGRKKVLQETGLVAVDTTGGYVVFGPVWRPQDLPEGDPVLYGSVLSEVLQRFWESEEPPTADRRKPEDDECELFYQYNTARCPSGRFVTRLPFLPNRPALENEDQLKFLQDLHKDVKHLDFWIPPSRVGEYVSVVSPPELRGDLEKKLKKREIPSKVVLKDIQSALDAQTQHRRKRSTSGSELFWDTFQTYEQIQNWFHHLEQQYPDIVTVVQVGQSYEDRNITGIKISRRSNRRSFFIEGGQVGADWLSPTVATYLVDQLIRGEDPEALAASEEYDWHIVPVVNPDGHQYSQDAERLWVKNRRPIPDTDQVGVDLTKNWNSQWGVSGGSHNAQANNFIGLGPFSEIETRSVSAYIESISSTLSGVLSLRQFGQRLLLPFAHSSDPMYNYNDMLIVGRRAMGSMSVRYGTQYIVGTSRNVHDGSTGMLADWVKHRFNPPVVATFQLRDNGAWGYVLPVGNVQPSCEETFDAVMAIIREAKFINVL
ncbi:zinc carboxypeptidase domain-containing protein [Phthorimaea operculella]|nr:zinc carboxypeptidase domain-containing protein [Phthorimaea operculella]